MMPEWLPSMCSTNSAALPWMPAAHAQQQRKILEGLQERGKTNGAVVPTSDREDQATVDAVVARRLPSRLDESL